MNGAKDLALDANIIIRAIFGKRVMAFLERYSEFVTFYSPEVCLEDVKGHIPGISADHRVSEEDAFTSLARIINIVRFVPRDDYNRFKIPASDRIRSRDITDWPLVATCLLLNAPLWTEDRDFFGCGIATWTTINVELYLRAPITS